MNMKKAIAGVFAGAVAISAVATTMASAKTVSYAAIDKTFELSGVTGYKASNYSRTMTRIYGQTAPTSYQSQVTKNGLTITANDNLAYNIILIANASLPAGTVIPSVDGTTITLIAKDLTSFTNTKVQTALNAAVGANKFTVTGGPATAADTWSLVPNAVVIPAGTAIDKQTAGNDILTLTFNQAIENFKITFNSAAIGGSVTLSEAKPDEDNNDGIGMSADGKIITISGLTLPASNYAVTMSYDVKAPSPSVFKYKSEAQKANPNKTVTVSATATDVVTEAGTTLFEAMIGTVDTFDASFEVKSADGDKNLEIVESNSGSYNSAYSVANWTSEVKDGVLKNGEDVVDAVSEAIEGRLKAQVIFNFDDPKWGSDDAVYVTAWFDTRDFGILKKTVKMDTSNWTAAFNWSDFVKSATSGTSTLGDVSNKIRDIRIAVDTRDENGKEIALKSITVKGPAESADVLSAGESVADTTAAITTAATAATTTAATTTAAASNPKTGNAPVALAVIPVAIAAAAIIAKKRG